MRKTWLLSLLFAVIMTLAMAVSASAAELIDITDSAGGGDTSESTPPPAPPPPEPEAKFVITIAAPKGWYTKSAAVIVKLEDVNGTGFDKAELKQGSNGAWQDISDALRADGQAKLDIFDDGTVYVAVTDKSGKAHVKSLYIECFDRDAPAVKAKITGRSLRVEADDTLSGIESIHVNGEEYDDLANDTLDVRVRELADKDEEEIFIYAVDCAGNRSKTISVINPDYEPPQSSKPTTPPPVEAPSQPPAASQPAAPPAQAPVAPAPAPVISAPPAAPPAQAAPPTPVAEPAADPGSVTPTQGSGTVIENSEKTPDQREFFTISTEAGNDFYIVVDKEKPEENVYLLSEVTEDDLMGLAKPSATPVPQAVPPVPEPEPVAEPEPTPEPEPVPPQPEAPPEPAQPSGNSSILLIVAVVVVCGGAAYYLKIVRPKKSAADPYEDEDDDAGEDGGIPDYDDEFLEDEYEQDGKESEE
jgi:hypothetical protein